VRLPSRSTRISAPVGSPDSRPLWAIWLYATNRPQLLWQRLDGRQRRAGLALGVFPGLVYLLAFLVAKNAPGVSLLIYAGLPLLYFLSITVLRSSRKRNQHFADFT
jgi:hypothetical protein